MKRNTDKVQLKMFRHDGGFYNYTGKLFDLFAVSIFWIIGCLPIITIGASTGAMYAAVSKSICRDQGTIGTVFWSTYKRDIIPNLKLGLIMEAAVFLVLLNIGIVRAKLQGTVLICFLLLYGFCLFVLIVMGIYLFPAVSRFAMPWGWFMKLSLYLVFRHLPTSLLIGVVTAVSYFLVLKQIALVLILPGVWCLITQYFIYPILQKHEPK